MMRGLKARCFRLSHDMSVAELLATERQDPALSRLLWHPLCIAALNTPAGRASAQVFANVLRDTLDASRADSDILLARCDLSALFPDPAAQFVRRHGGEILIGHTVSTVAGKEGGFEVRARGETRHFKQVICALSPHRMASVVAGLPELTDALRMVASFEYQPIYSVYLQYPEAQRLPAPMIGLDGAIAQWVFDRAAICGEPGRLAAVISAAGPHEDMPQEALAARVHAELSERFGPLPPPAWSRVVAEKRATFACTPGLERPAQRTPRQGFYLAGDYVEGDYPATLEAAVRSGIRAAQMIAG
jgi:squalene-associated FAD-dependent desaturase